MPESDAHIEEADIAISWGVRTLGCADWFAARVTTLGELDAAMKAARDSRSSACIEVVGERMDMPPILAFAHGRLGAMHGDAP